MAMCCVLVCRCGEDAILVVLSSSTVKVIGTNGCDLGLERSTLKPLHGASAAAVSAHMSKLAVAYGSQVCHLFAAIV
jgi:hypothetical protein